MFQFARRGLAAGKTRPTSATFSIAAIGVVALTVVLTLAGCGLSLDSQAEQDLDPAPVAATYSYQGAQQQTYIVPAGVLSVTITGQGGSGGYPNESDLSPDSAPGALVSGTLMVQPGQLLLISVAGDGESATSKDHDPQGGWGGLGAVGGNGNAASDDLRTGAAGGGATTVQLANPDGGSPVTVLVAGGGGGGGGPSGNPFYAGLGGSAGCLGNPDSPSWQGANGTNSRSIEGGKGGAAAGAAGMAGRRGQGGSGAGANGGGGGGGVNGGNPGGGASGTSAGGGGGAGSSAAYDMVTTSVTCAADSSNSGLGDGQVVVAPLPS